MALAAATPENLNEFAQELGTEIARRSGGGSGVALRIEAKIKKNFVDYDGIRHYYIGVDEGFDFEGVTLRLFRRGKVKWNAFDPDGDLEIQVPRTVGYYETRNIQNDGALFNPCFVSTEEPAFTENGKDWYEVTMEGYDNLEAYANSGEESGYLKTLIDPDQESQTYGEKIIRPIDVGYLLRKHRYLCLFKEGKRISNYVSMYMLLEREGGSSRYVVCV